MHKLLLLILTISFFSSAIAQDYNSITSSSKKLPGLLNVYNSNNDYYFEFDKSVEKKTFLLYSTNLTAIDNLSFFAGFPLSEMIIKFKEIKDGYNIIQYGNKILPDTSKYSNYNQEITSRFGPLKIDAKQNESDSAKKISKVNQFFESDIANLQYIFQSLMGGYYTINTDLTYIESVKSFPSNIEIIVNYVLNSQSAPNASVPDSRAINFVVRYSLVEIPENKNYIPRFYDNRIGYFTTSFKNYSIPDRKTEYTTYINRWDLKKKNEFESISEPVKPIVYWIDRATPVEYRDAIIKGVLMWNKAFENIGFKNAVRCYVQPDTATWDIEDIRYNVIRWQSSSSGGLAGVGPSIANPFTGELINASVLLNSEIAGFLRFEKDLAEIIRMSKPGEIKETENKIHKLFEKSGKGKHICSYASSSQIIMRNSLIKVLTDNEFQNEDIILKQFINNYLTDLVVHEVGHTLGLRHNFKSSTAYTLEQIRDSNFTKINSISSSVMDYNPLNISQSGLSQGEYWSSTIGNYDMFAIEYGYKIFPNVKSPEDEIPFLLAVASKSSDPYNRFGTDEDAYDMFYPTSLDPLTQIFDLGSSPLQYGKEQINISLDLFNKIQNYFPQYDRSYTQLTGVFKSVLYGYFSGSNFASKYIGGAYINRMKSGDLSQNRYPYEPVPYSEQLDALNLIIEYNFNADKYLNFSPEFLKQLQPNSEDYNSLYMSGGRMDVALDEIILNQQKWILWRLFHPIIMGRLIDQEKISSSAFTLENLFDSIKNGVWSELKTNQPISVRRRNLQKAYIDYVINILLKSDSEIPEESRSLAYLYLTNLRKEINSKKPSDIYEDFHLKECSSRIEKAINSVFIDSVK